MTWSLKGTYFESCNCDVACPCFFLSKPTTGECTVLVGWNIAEGNDEGVSLNGLSVALAVHSPGHMATTKWTAAVYLDAKATEAQNASLLKIFGGQAGGHPARLASHIGEVVGVASVPIEFSVNNGENSLRIPDIAEMQTEKLTGQGDGPITITGHPLCIAPGYPGILARVKNLTFNDHGMAWDISGTNGMFSDFAYQSEQ